MDVGKYKHIFNGFCEKFNLRFINEWENNHK